MKKLLLGWLMIFPLIGLYAQEISNYDLDKADGFTKDIRFNQEDSFYQIKLDLNNSIPYLAFNFKGEIDEGVLMVSIFDPNGKKEGGFELLAYSKADQKRKSTSVNGDMQKKINNPMTGTWTIEIKENDGIGSLEVTVNR